MAIKKGLGKGLSALLGDVEQEFSAREEKQNELERTQSSETPHEIPITQIEPNINQPRKVFDEVALTELANSIRIHGVISPIIVVKRDNGKYMIIAGERRWRASKRAGLMTMPAANQRNLSYREFTARRPEPDRNRRGNQATYGRLFVHAGTSRGPHRQVAPRSSKHVAPAYAHRARHADGFRR